MTRNSRRHNNLQSTLKDYLVPIIGWILILMLIYSFFNGDSSTATTNTDENRVPTQITFGSVDTQAFINYPGNTKEEITEANSLYKGETIIVKQWTVSLFKWRWDNCKPQQNRWVKIRWRWKLFSLFFWCMV